MKCEKNTFCISKKIFIVIDFLKNVDLEFIFIRFCIQTILHKLL